MNCRDARRILHAYVDTELDVTGALAMEEHLRACNRCLVEETGLRTLRTAVRRHTDAGTAPDALRELLWSRYAREKTSPDAWLRRRLTFAIPAVAALSLAALIGLGTFIGLKGMAGDGGAAERHSKVVYHISTSDTASAALRNLANHLEAAPDAQVVVVAHNNGVNFLLRGARDESGELYEEAVRKFAARGVRFRVCNNTLVRQSIVANRVVPEATLVPSGIAEIGRLQSQDGYAYMKL